MTPELNTALCEACEYAGHCHVILCVMRGIITRVQQCTCAAALQL